MQTAPAFQPAAAAPSRAGDVPQRRVIDAPTRMFHWLFALSFLGATFTVDGERWRALHVTLGYTLAGLLAFRVLYGLFGPRQAGLGLMLRKLTSAPAWLRSAAQGLRTSEVLSINWRQGQNLLMALAVLALLLAAVLAFVSWQWLQSPQGLMPTQGMTQQGSDRHHDDDD